MGKSIKFSFQLSGRKVNTVSNSTSTGSDTPLSKAQRILGAEAIEVNICKSDKIASYQECGNSSPTSLSAHTTTLSRFGTREETHKDTLPNIKGKASSILGIFKDQAEGKKSVSPSIRSVGARTSSKSWMSRIEDNSHETPSDALKQNQHSCLSELESDMKNVNSPQFGQLAHIATYIGQVMDPLPELPGDFSMNETSEAEMPRNTSASHRFNVCRPISSSSCPAATKHKSTISEKSRDTYPQDCASSQRSIYTPTRPQLWPKNRSLPNAPSLTNTCSTGQDNDTGDEDEKADEHRKDSPLTELQFTDEGSDIPMILRSSWNSILANHYELGDTTPPEVPYLQIPEFADIQLSGPWNETLEDQQFMRTSKLQNIPRCEYSNVHQNAHSTAQYPPVNQEQSYHSSPREAYISHSPIQSYSPLRCDFLIASKESEEMILEAENQSITSDDEKLINSSRTPFCLQNSPVSTKAQTNSCPTNSPNSSIASLSDDDGESSQKIPLFLDKYSNDWDHSIISSLCIDYDSASSATLLRNEPAYKKTSDEDVHSEIYNDSYSPTVLMEVARIGMVIQKTPVKEMIRGRQKEKSGFKDIKDLPCTNGTREFSKSNFRENYGYDKWS